MVRAIVKEVQGPGLSVYVSTCAVRDIEKSPTAPFFAHHHCISDCICPDKTAHPSHPLSKPHLSRAANPVSCSDIL